MWMRLRRKAGWIGMALVLLSGSGMRAEPALAGRREIPLTEGWRFRFDAQVPAVTSVDTSGWESVSVPHSWNVADATSPNYRRGPGWYQLKFATPTHGQHERVYLQFDAVSLVAEVWLNGSIVGTHVGGFSRFRFDVTSLLRRAGENELVVCADSTARDDVLPREGDFTIYGGIYRPVSLVIAPAVGIDLLDFGGPGVYLTPEVESAEAGTIKARVLVRNSESRAHSVVVGLTVLDATGATVARRSVSHEAAPGVSTVMANVAVTHPRLWAGRRDPYLYRVRTTVTADAASDQVTEPLGFRTCALEDERGFLLNGEPYELYGVNTHQESGNKGWATSEADRAADFAMIAELGCTFVRMTHYQHASSAFDESDRLGLVVWAEHPLVNTVSASPRFGENALTGLRELIRQNYNHPSVAFWGIGNEVQIPSAPTASTLLETLARTVRLEDSSRLASLATNYEEPVGAYGVSALAHNQYHGWYHHEPRDFVTWLDSQREKSPGKTLGVSEYGAGASPHIHRADPARLDHSEEYQSLLHEAYWPALHARPWVWCKAVWVMFDFASAARKEGDTPGINDKGLVTRDRATKKDAFYFYQANWTKVPMVHLASRRFTPRHLATTSVKVYSNCDRVELFLNGKSLGEQAAHGGIATWPNVALVRGENHVSVMGRRAGTDVRDECVWVFEPEKPGAN